MAKLVNESLEEIFEAKKKKEPVKTESKKDTAKVAIEKLQSCVKEVEAKLKKKSGPIAKKKLDLELKGYKDKIEGWKKKMNEYFEPRNPELEDERDYQNKIDGYPSNYDLDLSGQNLTSLEGECPEEVNGNFDCSHNELTSLRGCPVYVSGAFFCHDNSEQFSEEEVRQVCDVKGRIYC